MPDIISVLARRGKLIFILTAVATILALVISLLRPKEYLAVATALPANSLAADKARIFNSNIESLYPELGTPDELDRIEGTAKLDTIYIAVADRFDLASHYGVDKSTTDVVYKAAQALKKNTDIRRSAYGELKIRVWDGEPTIAAQLANALLNKLNEIHQHIQNTNNAVVLQRLRQGLTAKQQEFDSIATEMIEFQTNGMSRINDEPFDDKRLGTDSGRIKPGLTLPHIAARSSTLQQQVKEYENIISQYELAVNTNPQVLIAVENARPSIWPDKPKTAHTVLFAFGASLIFSFLLALLAESRKR